MSGFEVAHSIPHDYSHTFINQTLIAHGLLGTTPIKPRLAIPILTPEVYCQCHLHNPQFSVQQWVRVLCDISNVE